MKRLSQRMSELINLLMNESVKKVFVEQPRLKESEKFSLPEEFTLLF